MIYAMIFIEFWRLTKEVGGLSQQRHASAPDVEELADHLAENIWNRKDDQTPDWEPKRGSKNIALSTFKIRYNRVWAVLEGADTSKSVYGVNAQLLQWCASEIAPPVCSLFKYMVGESVFPEKWKIGRVTAVHRRDETKKTTNYRPVQSLERLEVCV